MESKTKDKGKGKGKGTKCKNKGSGEEYFDLPTTDKPFFRATDKTGNGRGEKKVKWTEKKKKQRRVRIHLRKENRCPNCYKYLSSSPDKNHHFRFCIFGAKKKKEVTQTRTNRMKLTQELMVRMKLIQEQMVRMKLMQEQMVRMKQMNMKIRIDTKYFEYGAGLSIIEDLIIHISKIDLLNQI